MIETQYKQTTKLSVPVQRQSSFISGFLIMGTYFRVGYKGRGRGGGNGDKYTKLFHVSKKAIVVFSAITKTSKNILYTYYHQKYLGYI